MINQNGMPWLCVKFFISYSCWWKKFPLPHILNTWSLKCCSPFHLWTTRLPEHCSLLLFSNNAFAETIFIICFHYPYGRFPLSSCFPTHPLTVLLPSHCLMWELLVCNPSKSHQTWRCQLQGLPEWETLNMWCGIAGRHTSSSSHGNLRTHSWSWALIEKPPIVQLLKNFPSFYGTWRFIIVFKRALPWSLSWARLVQFIPSHCVSLRFPFWHQNVTCYLVTRQVTHESWIWSPYICIFSVIITVSTNLQLHFWLFWNPSVWRLLHCPSSRYLTLHCP
jgi:hypothetical protein